MATHAKHEEQNKVKATILKETIGSFVSFFSIVYAVMLVASISYNIGYFKYINPQIVELMTLGDYINDTVHNVWLFLFAALLFFISSVAFIKKKKDSQQSGAIVFGVFILIVSGCFLSKGITNNNFWPTLKILLLNSYLLPAFIFLFSFIVAGITYKFSQEDVKGRILNYMLSLIPIVVFVILVLSPYLSGMIQGYIESNYLAKDDYKIQSVDITVTPDNKVFKDIFIVKQVERGLVLRQLNKEGSLGRFFFINWINVKMISYKDVNKFHSEP